MREIKFRAWHNKNNEMMYWDELKNTHINNLFQSCFNLMQYTGLKDKNGKEIYEGDICRIKYVESKPDIVEFKNGCFKFRYRDHYVFNYEEVEVIGNIYENPELLK